ncbi:hypothetical protein GCU56_21450 [Geodermatophilus sabuli]|uniref:Uncharacterized protein n=1 Tax=Geodermatophilus sabuli TaxID=1564158 RepID=A0A7K3W950_9ACTN|nr:hypothetical protein [Geodermatophilus sabuli]NEK60427.1 hypothetical protein [Geodermatophilus sabuli]
MGVVVDVQNDEAAIGQMAQASLRSGIRKSGSTTRSPSGSGSTRARADENNAAVDWGVRSTAWTSKGHPARVDEAVDFPPGQAEWKHRSRVITAEEELQFPERLEQAAAVIAAGLPPGNCAC